MPISTAPPPPFTLLSVGEIAQELQESPRRVSYAITCAGIDPAAQAAGVNLYLGAQLAAIREALSAVRKNRPRRREVARS